MPPQLHALESLDGAFAVEFADLVVNQRYEQALELADSVNRSEPDSPHGWFLQSLALNARMIDFEDEIDRQPWHETCDSVESISNRLLEESPANPTLFFYLGTVYSFRSYRHANDGDLIAAYLDAVKGGGYFKDALKADSSYYDAYFGIGSYNYYRSDKAGILRSVGVVADRRDLGLAQIARAADNGTFTKAAARSALAWIAVENEQNEEALRIAKELLNDYPDCRSFLWCLGRAQINLEQWEPAIYTYSRILDSVRTEERNNHYNELGCLHSIALAQSELEDWRAVELTANEALSIGLSDEVKDRKSKDLKHLKEFLKQARKKIKEDG
ncbi:tetratricopeptide repeat protein [Calditrichota bacterium]